MKVATKLKTAETLKQVKKIRTETNSLLVTLYFGRDNMDQADRLQSEIDQAIEDHLTLGAVYLLGDNELLVTESVQEKNAYQLTTFDAKGPVSHATFKTMDQVASRLKSDSAYPLNTDMVRYV